MQQILDTVTSFDGALVLAPDASSGAPELAWGDYFFYYAPDGRVPANGQPYATIVTKNYPGDTGSDLDGDDRWRVNVHVGRAAFERLTSHGGGTDPAEPDVVLPHPVYGRQGWIAVVNPGERTSAQVLKLLRDAHERARARALRKLG
ncbi:hypothetical protein BA062_06140 [Prauserella flavalba]|uniref:DUF6194 domain-containing protein n=1 Tax=Prauserella flavalba TaxID=1477506 RepID=A0A318LS63_9PSEU|nr:hypothetical protein BA062_06140 [Prauserella flavalba]